MGDEVSVRRRADTVDQAGRQTVPRMQQTLGQGVGAYIRHDCLIALTVCLKQL